MEREAVAHQNARARTPSRRPRHATAARRILSNQQSVIAHHAPAPGTRFAASVPQPPARQPHNADLAQPRRTSLIRPFARHCVDPPSRPHDGIHGPPPFALAGQHRQPKPAQRPVPPERRVNTFTVDCKVPRSRMLSGKHATRSASQTRPEPPKIIGNAVLLQREKRPRLLSKQSREPATGAVKMN
ncbi:hypothetical protein KCP69_00765 [Salmonella enterica subsp. enterica]|nr:hypothetical protein KCP69_00765 [Salmonella enterica subsp. enterica]